MERTDPTSAVIKDLKIDGAFWKLYWEYKKNGDTLNVRYTKPGYADLEIIPKHPDKFHSDD